MIAADLIEKEKYENQLGQLLVSEEAIILFDPNSFRFEMSYYEHGFDRITFIINDLEYSIPGCITSLSILHFIVFNRSVASEIFAQFQEKNLVKLVIILILH